VKVATVFANMLSLLISRQGDPHVECILPFHRAAYVVGVVVYHTTENAIPQRFVELDGRSVGLAHKKINEPGVLLLARLLECSREQSSVAQPTILRGNGQGCDVSVPWKVVL